MHPSGVALLETESVSSLNLYFTTCWTLLITLTQKTVLRGKYRRWVICTMGPFWFFFSFPLCRKSRTGIFFKRQFIMNTVCAF